MYGLICKIPLNQAPISQMTENSGLNFEKIIELKSISGL